MIEHEAAQVDHDHDHDCSPIPLTGMPECPVCESQFAEFMGALGSRVHFRCGACGSDYSEPLDT